jgi:hypothetical protein
MTNALVASDFMDCFASTGSQARPRSHVIPSAANAATVSRQPSELNLVMSNGESIKILGHRTQPVWLASVIDRLAHLGRLPLGWDAEGGLPIDLQVLAESVGYLLRMIAHTRGRVAAPQIVPTSAGGLQLEWHQDGVNLEIRFDPTEPVQVYYRQRRTGEERDIAGLPASEAAVFAPLAE